MRTHLARLTGKLISQTTRTLKLGGGSAAPGLYALKIDPDLVSKLIKQIPKNVIITGTNGKTTTARILAYLAEEAGLKVIRNSTGSNLERGIASALINHISWGSNVSNPRGWLRSDLGIWEVDEFAFNDLALKIKPDLVLFLNVSRDQLDRYGEVDKVVNRWCKTVSKLNPKTTVLINPQLDKLKDYFKVKEFDKPKNIKSLGLNGSEFELNNTKIKLSAPGLYNIENAVYAITAANYLQIPIASLDKFTTAFGRFERLEIKGKQTFIFLIKNPAGATAVFETIANELKPDDSLLFALNDNFADGKDVSWIWDAKFEKLLSSLRATKGSEAISLKKEIASSSGSSWTPRNDVGIICSGTRAQDMAVRIKYAEFDPKLIVVETNMKKALERATRPPKGRLFILPTYTALLELQKLLAKQGIKQHYWQE